ncbi:MULTISPECIES: APC family permease [Holospora]|uniref:Arginine/agmatine antiporter n=2 Tax=Holospora TaxID=44747 RepID=A0A061JI61_9PROT|nr:MULTISPECIES: amino acid permease [Holospora]ETZ04694.1 arginine/agmatine antiporter [Holospora undulata HU1]GAJ46225.1 arginine/agmatine antiporter [Holospora elegans E1]
MEIQKREKMNLFSVIAFVIGLQLGSALFLLPEQLGVYGSWGALSWIVSGLGALSLTLIFSVLSKTDPAFGGPSVYIEKAFGKSAGFYSTWAYWFISWFSSVPLLLLAISSLESALGCQFSFSLKIMTGAAMLAGVSVLNLYGAVISGWGEIIFALFKVLPWIVIPVITIAKYGWGTGVWSVSEPPLRALSASSLLTFWGFVGLEASTTITDVVKNPKRNLPLALFFGTACVLCIYFINTWIIMSSTSFKPGINPLTELIKNLFGPWGNTGFSLTAMMMCLGTLNSWLLASGQMISVALRSGLINVKPSKIDPTAFGVLVTAFMLAGTTFLIQIQKSEGVLGQVIELCCSIFIMIYLACLAALIRFILYKKVQVSWWFWGVMLVAGGFSVWSLYTVPLSFWIVPGVLFITGRLIKGRFIDTSITLR